MTIVFRKNLYLLLLALPLLMACQDQTEEGDEPIATSAGITDFRQALSVLRQACAEGKTVDAITPLYGNCSGWDIRFTDSTTISIIHSREKADSEMVQEPSLYFCIDADSVWTLREFDDTQGTRTIPVDLSDGQETTVAGGFSHETCLMKPVYDVLHHQCNYFFYHPTDSTLLSPLSTLHPSPFTLHHYTKDYGQTIPLVTCIVEDQQTRTVKMTMIDGEEICFSKHYDKPEQIAWEMTIPASVCCGDTLTLPFRVAPSQALFSHKVNTDSSDVRLYCQAPDGSLQPSAVFTLGSVKNAPNGNGYEAIIIPNVDVDYPITENLVLTIHRSAEGRLQGKNPPSNFQSSIFNFQSSPSTIEASLQPKGTILRPQSGLPVVFINTPGQQTIESKEYWMENAQVTIYQPDGTIDYQGTTDIRARGNSTFGFPKMPYALKLPAAAEVLGMPADRRWALLANWIDRTLMRNDVAFAISRAAGMEWVPQGRFVDVVMNHRYVGNYYLCEQVRATRNRLRIDDGFLLEIDFNYDEPNRFHSIHRNLPYMIKSPDADELTEEQFNSARQFIDSLELSLYCEDRFERHDHWPLIDMRSFAQYWIVQELTTNREPAYPKSIFLYRKSMDDKLKTAVWDFDYATFMDLDDFVLKDFFYYDRLFLDQQFVRCVKDVWMESRQALLDVVQNYIDQQAAAISVSEEANHRLWPITGDEKPCGDEDLPFREAVARLKHNALNRFRLLDNELSH